MLDEADRMLDKGFENDIRSIIGRTMQGAERQTLMCKCSCASLGVDAGCAHRTMQSARRGRMPFGGSLRPSSATRSGLLSAATTSLLTAASSKVRVQALPNGDRTLKLIF